MRRIVAPHVARTAGPTLMLFALLGCAEHIPPGLYTQIVRAQHAYVVRESGALMMTVFTPCDAPPHRPMVVAIHGGAFRKGNRGRMDGMATFLAGQGFIAATIDYRLAPEHPFPAAAADAVAAVRYVKANATEFSGDPQRVATLGASAGGNLAMMAAYCRNPDADFGECGDSSVSPEVSAVVSIFGPSDFTVGVDRAPWYLRRLAVDYVGTTYDADPARWKLASPRYHATADSPPTLIVHGEYDRVVSFAQATLLDRELDRLGVPHWLVRVKTGHGFLVPLGADRHSHAVLPAIATFLTRMLDETHRSKVESTHAG